MYEYEGTVRRVVDGDTIDVEIDLGLEIRFRTRLRLAGVNAPELNTSAGQRAKEELELIFAASPSVTIRTIKDKKEKYGRYLCHVLCQDGTFLNEWLVQSGLADRA